MKEISLSQGKFALVNDEDYSKVINYPCKWIAYRDRYVWYSRAHKSKGGNACISMHRFILEPKDDEQVDHIDGNGLNNQRDNLRVANSSQQRMNSEKRRNTLSIYKGVFYCKSTKKWRVLIIKNYHLHHLGYFKDEKEAALVYDVAAQELFGEYAKLNFEWKEEVVR